MKSRAAGPGFQVRAFAHAMSAVFRHASDQTATRMPVSRLYPVTSTMGDRKLRWEYKVVTETMNDDELNEFGAGGWDLVMVVSPAHFVFHYFFKREVRG
jgi:hypothetical protein